MQPSQLQQQFEHSGTSRSFFDLSYTDELSKSKTAAVYRLIVYNIYIYIYIYTYIHIQNLKSKIMSMNLKLKQFFHPFPPMSLFVTNFGYSPPLCSTPVTSFLKLQAVNLQICRKINSVKSILNYFVRHLRTLTDAKEKTNNFKMQCITRCSLYV